MSLNSTVRALDSFSHDEIRAEARAAAENNSPQHDANPFPEGTTQHAQFAHAYWACHRERNDVEA